MSVTARAFLLLVAACLPVDNAESGATLRTTQKPTSEADLLGELAAIEAEWKASAEDRKVPRTTTQELSTTTMDAKLREAIHEKAQAIHEKGYSRLRIRNGCAREPVWIAHMAGTGHGPDAQDVKIEPHEFWDFNTPDGYTSTRFWPKFGCKPDGHDCQVGDSGGPGEVCSSNVQCAPPVDTKFEATFGVVGQGCDIASGQYAGCDWVDVSLVDGYTVPFKFELKGGKCHGGDGKALDNSSSVLDCSKLHVGDCPVDEDMGASVGDLLRDLGRQQQGVDLRVIHPESKKVVGCYAPCSKLTLRQWDNHIADRLSPKDPLVAPYCCPTPPESPEECRAGPVPTTQYVQKIHSMCPGVYGYSYDDGMGLLTCDSGTEYEFTVYCPSQPTKPATTTTTTSTTPLPPAPAAPGPVISHVHKSNSKGMDSMLLRLRYSRRDRSQHSQLPETSRHSPKSTTTTFELPPLPPTQPLPELPTVPPTVPPTAAPQATLQPTPTAAPHTSLQPTVPPPPTPPAPQATLQPTPTAAPHTTLQPTVPPPTPPPAPTLPPGWPIGMPLVCKVAEFVPCPEGTPYCIGNTCCPDGSTCPSSSEDHTPICATAKKIDCVNPPGSRDIVA